MQNKKNKQQTCLALHINRVLDHTSALLYMCRTYDFTLGHFFFVLHFSSEESHTGTETKHVRRDNVCSGFLDPIGFPRVTIVK